MKKYIGILVACVMAFSLVGAVGCGDKEDSNTDNTGIATETESKIDVKTYALEIKASANELAEYMSDALSKGYVDQARVDEYNSACARLDEIIANPENTQAVKDELDVLKNNIAVMASQAAAPNEVIDSIVENKGNNVEVEDSNEGVSEEPKPLNNDMTTLIDNFTLLQNEASQKVEKGTITEEEYLALIQDGTNLAALKEEMEKLGESDDLNKRIDECRNRIHETAVKLGSDLADKF